MLKPDSLRAWLTAAIPALAADPAQLQLFVDRGQVVSTGTPGLAFEYRYTLNLLLTDFAGHPDGLFAPLLAWLGLNQPDLLQRIGRTGDGLAFEADILDNEKVDLSVTFPLSETVVAVPRPADAGGGDGGSDPGGEPGGDPGGEPGGGETPSGAGGSFEVGGVIYDVTHQAEPQTEETWPGVPAAEAGQMREVLLYLQGQLIARVPAPAE